MKPEIKKMIDTIESEAAYTAEYTGRKHFSKRVLAAMAKVDREQFVPEGYRIQAYNNGPLPIGYGQTISQPYIVALMTDLLDLNQESVVLEVGTGSGYQAAILSLLAGEVYTLERVSELADSARQRFQELGYHNIEVRAGDGGKGWPEKAPFDAIIVTAAASQIPDALVQQLKPGGRMVIPVGQPHLYQELKLLTRDEQGKTHTKTILGVAFVPLILDEPSAPENGDAG